MHYSCLPDLFFGIGLGIDIAFEFAFGGDGLSIHNILSSQTDMCSVGFGIDLIFIVVFILLLLVVVGILVGL